MLVYLLLLYGNILFEVVQIRGALNAVFWPITDL